MESAYMKNLIRKIGKSYKDIYNEKNKYGWFNGKDDLIKKYVSIEKTVLYDHKKLGADNDSEALTIVYHGLKRDFGGKLHLQFDEDYPVIHLISYETDVADYNIKTHELYMGEKYSPTTESHMGDFQCLFSFKNTKAQKGTGKLKHDDIIGDYWTGLSIDELLTKTTTEMNLVDSLSQNRVFDDLFVRMYKQGTKKYHVFKYQLKQMTQILLTGINAYDDMYGQCGLADHIVQGKLSVSNAFSELSKLYQRMCTGLYNKDYVELTEYVDINQHYDSKNNEFITRNLDKSYKVLKAILGGLLNKYSQLGVKKVSA